MWKPPEDKLLKNDKNHVSISDYLKSEMKSYKYLIILIYFVIFLIVAFFVGLLVM